MTPDRDLERLLNEWFGEGPSEVSDRVIDQLTDRIDRQSQRPAWRLRWREPQVNLNLRWAAAAAVLVVAVFAGTRLLGPTPNSETGGISPAPSSSPSPAPAATYSVTAGPQGATVLHAPNFFVPLSVTFGADWKIAAVDKGVVDLLRGDVDMGIHSTALVTLPGATLADDWIPVPADFVAWINERPEFVPSAPRSVTIAGRSGTVIDADFTWKDGTAARDFLRYGTGAWLYDQYNVGHRARFIILPGPSGVDGLVIVMNAPGADFEAAATSLDAMLATLQFDTGPVFSSAEFEFPLTLTLVDGWTVSGDSPGSIELFKTESNLDPAIMSIASLKVASAPGGLLEPWPADFQAWLAAQPEFKPGNPKAVTVGGRPAVQVDVDVSLSPTDSSRAVIEYGSNNWKTVKDPERWRFIVVATGPGAGLVILMPVALDKAAEAAASLDKLLATLTFR